MGTLVARSVLPFCDWLTTNDGKHERWSRASFLKLAVLVLICVAIILFVVYGKTEWITDFGEWSEEHRVEGAFD